MRETRALTICILTDAYKGSASVLKEYDLPCDPSPYLGGHQCQLVALEKATAVQRIVELSQRKFDVFINLCDGAWDEDRAGIEVVLALERLNLPFSGATSAFYEPSRESMKRVCAAWDVATPAYVLAEHEEDVERAERMLRFPMIVKHPSSYSSIGLTRDSVVHSALDLRRVCSDTMKTFGGALIEEFIDGREFTVLVAENPHNPEAPTAYEPVEYRFPQGETFKHFDLKWIDYDSMTPVPCDDPVVSEALKEMSRRLFMGLGGTGYGRCDVRMDSEGRLYMLEINPNCGVFYPMSDPGSADAILMNDPAGHAGFAHQIIEAALARHASRQRKWKILADRNLNYGMWARIPIRSGEVIEAYEGRPHNLVSRAQVERTWFGRSRSWFHQYAYPVSEDIYAIWADRPEDWRPINHSCEPSAWLSGLNLVARRDLAPGEEITLDYATFCTETLEAFECRCEAENCRGTVRGTDYLQPFVARYGDHVSDHVRRARRLRP